MNIPQIVKNKTMSQMVQEMGTNTVRDTKSESVEKSNVKNRVDSSEITGSHVNAFEDKRLSSFKTALLYELSSDHQSRRAEEIRERVQNGSYKVEDEGLAEALLGD